MRSIAYPPHISATSPPHLRCISRCAGFLEATAKSIRSTLSSLPAPADAHILYTAQGLPRKYVEDLGDPYAEQVERCVQMVTEELSSAGVANPHSLAYQGAFGPAPLRWLEPSTSDQIEELASRGVTSLVLVPISFVFEHMGTLQTPHLVHCHTPCTFPSVRC